MIQEFIVLLPVGMSGCLPWRFFSLLGFETERVVGREVVDLFFLFCLDACLVAARWALCCWRRRWPALRVRAW